MTHSLGVYKIIHDRLALLEPVVFKKIYQSQAIDNVIVWLGAGDFFAVGLGEIL